MKRIFLWALSGMLSLNAWANINYIDRTKIGNEPRLAAVVDYLTDNQQFFDHWSSEWNYALPKNGFIAALHDNYQLAASVVPKNAELYLLLGDISSYLYNLDDTAYYCKAVENYQLAIEASPDDYRGYWFLGHHYASSNAPIPAIENFKNAEQRLPPNEPADFWNDYAWATAVANMPSHCSYAMDKVKLITGQAGSFEEQLGSTIRNRIEPLDKRKSFAKEELWTATEGEQMNFCCRPLGIKVTIDADWGLMLYDFEKGQTAFVISPPAIKNKKGAEIGYTIGILMKTAEANENLADYLNGFVSPYPKKTKIAFSDKYDKLIAYELIDKSVYTEMGGAHMYVIGIERMAPAYPGLLLEEPASLPQGTPGEVSYYQPLNCKDRFDGKLFYAIMLDSCEDINEQSLAVLKELFNQQIVIE